MFERTKKIALALAIVIVINIFFNYGIFTFYKSPEYEDFCSFDRSRIIETKEECEAINGKWGTGFENEPFARQIEVPPKATAFCDIDFNCRQEFRDVNDVYNKNVFIILLILGILTLIIGLYGKKAETVSNGLLFGGILSIIIGVMRYWSSAPDYLRFVLSGIALIILLFIGYKKFNDKK